MSASRSTRAQPPPQAVRKMSALLQVKVKLHARASSIEQMPDGTWLARLTSPPVDGKANAELVALVAEHFGCRKTAVEIKAGASGRTKLLEVDVN